MEYTCGRVVISRADDTSEFWFYIRGYTFDEVTDIPNPGGWFYYVKPTSGKIVSGGEWRISPEIKRVAEAISIYIRAGFNLPIQEFLDGLNL